MLDVKMKNTWGENKGKDEEHEEHDELKARTMWDQTDNTIQSQLLSLVATNLVGFFTKMLRNSKTTSAQ
jgi:hypothetical protein